MAACRTAVRFGLPALFIGLLLAGLAVRAHWETLGYALVGFDTYGQIFASRILSFDDFLDTFREELTDGRIQAHFFRPLQNLSVALDYALYGLSPTGYHASSLIVLALTVFVLFLAVRRLLGPNALLGAAIAAAFFGLHPVLLNVVPTVCRRSELLLVLFLCAALWVAPQHDDRKSWPRSCWAGVFVLLAAGAKEIGVMGVGLLFLHQLLFNAQGGPIRTLQRGVLMTLPAALLAGLYLVNRTLVIGGLGGYVKTPTQAATPYLTNLWEYGRELLPDIFCPWIFFRTETLFNSATEIGAGLVMAAVWFALCAGALSFCVGAPEVGRKRAGAALILGLAWLVPSLGTLGLLIWYGSWYAVVPLAGVAITLGALADLARTLLRGQLAERAFAGVYGLFVIGVMMLALRGSPLWIYYPEWRRATETMNASLAQLARDVEAAPDGAIIDVEIKPYYDLPEPPGNRVQLKWVATTRHVGIDCWAKMTFPHRRIRTSLSSWREAQAARADELVIRVKNFFINRE